MYLVTNQNNFDNYQEIYEIVKAVFVAEAIASIYPRINTYYTYYSYT
jgi:hypothetical protein